GQVCRVQGPLPCFPSMGLSTRRLPSLLRVPASPVPRSHRHYEGATTSHPRVHGHLIGSLPLPTGTSLGRVRRSAPGRTEALFQARALGQPVPKQAGSPYVDAYGISQVFRQSVPCLCSVPGPRSNRRVLTVDGHASAAPAIRTTKASALADFGANPQLRHLLPYASRV